MSHRVLQLGVAILSVLTLQGVAAAGDCKNVRFQFTNGISTKLRVKSIYVKGNDGSWNEQIGDKQIEVGGTHTTGNQDLQKLDSGKAGTFTVNYESWSPANNRWEAEAQQFANQMCSDGKTFRFNLTSQ